MFELAPAPLLFRRCGLFLLLAQFSLYVFGLPPFQMGIWYQTEPTLAAIFIFAIGAAAWLLVGIMRNYLVPQAPHPVWVVLILWVVWQVIASALAHSFWRSWFGPPELGEGAARSIALLLLSMVAYPFWQVESYRRLILIFAGNNILLQCCLHWLSPFNPEKGYELGTWVPARFAAYLAFMTGNMWIAALMGGQIKRIVHIWLMVFFTLAVLWLSLNKSAMVLLGAAIAVTGIVGVCARSRLLARLLQVGKTWRCVMILACFLPMGWIGFSVYYGGSVGLTSDGFFNYILSKNEALGSRVALNQVAVSTMQHEPSRWLAGDGWGRFTDDIFKYALVDGVYVFKNGIHAPNWAPLEGSAYHSHSQPLEVLLSLGLPGLVLWFALPVVALMTLPRNYFWACGPMLVALVMLTYFWFEMPQCLAYDALLIAALSTQGSRIRWCVINNVWAMMLVNFCGIAMLWSAQSHIQAMRYGDALSVATLSGQPFEGFSAEYLASDIERGGDRFYGAATNYALQLGYRTTIDDNDRGWYGRYIEAAHIVSLDPNIGARAASTELWLQYKLLIDFGGFHSFAELGHQAILTLPESVMLVTQKAPLRDDYASFFLVNLNSITNDNKNRQVEILQSILDIAPDHRPATWVMGKILSTQKDHVDEGKSLMERAAWFGVNTVYPVTDDAMEVVTGQQKF